MWEPIKVSNGAKIRNRYNQVPHLTQDTNKVMYTVHCENTLRIEAIECINNESLD